jgi:hypothetical protein
MTSKKWLFIFHAGGFRFDSACSGGLVLLSRGQLLVSINPFNRIVA